MTEHVNRTPCPRCGGTENFGHVCPMEMLAPGMGHDGDWPLELAFKAVRELLQGKGAEKHGDAWKARDVRYYMSRHDNHLVKAFSDEYPDYDATDGSPHVVNAAADLLIVVQKYLMEQHPSDSTGES